MTQAERDAVSRARGYDRRGDGKTGVWRCTCEWGWRSHGDSCPEHGTPGVVIPDPAATGVALASLAADHAEWSRATFGADHERGPVGPLRHLAKEAVETELAWVTNSDPAGCPDPEAVRAEFADCLLLLLDASRRAGLTPADLVAAAARKMAVNKARVWPKTSADEPVEHVREGE